MVTLSVTPGMILPTQLVPRFQSLGRTPPPCQVMFAPPPPKFQFALFPPRLVLFVGVIGIAVPPLAVLSFTSAHATVAVAAPGTFSSHGVPLALLSKLT